MGWSVPKPVVPKPRIVPQAYVKAIPTAATIKAKALRVTRIQTPSMRTPHGR